MRIPIVGVDRQNQALAPELREAFSRVLSGGRFILGSEVEAFEEAAAAYLGTQEAIGVSSGTDALAVALRAAGVSPGDEVVTTPFSFFATVGAILNVGAVPRFADIASDGFNLDVSNVERCLGPKTRAVVCVHLFGVPAPGLELRSLCDARGIALIEDAAQAFGAAEAGHRVGSIGHLGCFSFFPSKPLGGLGDGGLITTTDPGLATQCRLLRAHGATRPHEHRLLGGNHRLDAVQAALLRAKLSHVDDWRLARAAHAAAYDRAFSGLADVEVPRLPKGHDSAHAHYTLRLRGRAAGRREGLVEWLASQGVQAAVYYRRPLYAQAVPELARTLTGREAAECPNTEQRVDEVVSLPLFAELEVDEREWVVSRVREFLS